jgi:hypothetical protein
LDKNPYDEFIREVVASYKSSHRVKIPGIIFTDIQYALGPSAEIIIAANSEDKGISAEKQPKQSKSRRPTPFRNSPYRNKTLDLITPKTLDLITPKTLDLITRTIIVDD